MSSKSTKWISKKGNPMRWIAKDTFTKKKSRRKIAKASKRRNRAKK